MGHAHGKNPVKFNKLCKFGIADNFKLNRVISFLFNMFMFMNTINTTYGYIYFYTYLPLLIIGLLSLFVIVISSLIHLHYFMYRFQNDLAAMDAEYGVNKWIKNNLKYLVILSIISCSLCSAICFANCHLFCFKWFMMGLSDVQILSFVKLQRI